VSGVGASVKFAHEQTPFSPEHRGIVCASTPAFFIAFLCSGFDCSEAAFVAFVAASTRIRFSSETD
jgi:hypothetical protein